LNQLGSTSRLVNLDLIELHVIWLIVFTIGFLVLLIDEA
jgi:hypothetical protein